METTLVSTVERRQLHALHLLVSRAIEWHERKGFDAPARLARQLRNIEAAIESSVEVQCG